MSVRRLSPLLFSVVCAALSANIASAQCNHGGGFSPGGGGFGPRMPPGLISQQLLQQQQILMQQQLLQQLQQQQQLLQTAKTDRHMRDLAKEGPDAIQSALKSPNPETRLTAVLTIAKYGPALTDDLIERLTDENAAVRQAARRTLVKLSTVRDGKPNKVRSVDFGPVANANRKAQQSSARKWRTWFDRQQKREVEAKSIAERTSLSRLAVNEKTK